MSERNNQATPKEDYSFRDFAKERSTQTKIGMTAILGGIAIELTTIAIHSMDKVYSQTNELLNNNVATDLRLTGLLSIIAGSTIIADRINRKSN